MDPFIEDLWDQMPDILDDPELLHVRARLNEQLRAGMGTEFSEKIWDIADEMTAQQKRESFQQGFRFAGRLVLAMLA